ncbi:MAG: MFS transporter [Pseudomonadota bacterium]|nr:MFS transporter [Pseudomonadota bacterium]
MTAGVVAALQVGKAAIAVPLLRADLGLSLGEVAWVLSAYGLLGALCGMPVGLLVPRYGPKRAVVAGLLAVAAGSAIGAFAQGAGLLIASRGIESFGYLVIAVGVPTLLARLTATRDRDLTFAVWGTFMPVGTAIMLVVGTALASVGWRGLWLANALLAAGYVVVVLRTVPADARPAARHRTAAVLRDAAAVLRTAGPILLALAFAAYTFQYFALSGFLPVLLVDRMGLPIATAGLLSAGAVAMNAAGNVAAGALLRRGVPLWLMIASAFAGVALLSLGIFTASLPAFVVAVLAALSLGVSGLTPGSVFAGAPRLAPSPALVSATLGVIVQASNLGQLVGPSIVGAWVERAGWPAAPVLLVPAAAGGFAVALGLRALMRKSRI